MRMFMKSAKRTFYLTQPNKNNKYRMLLRCGNHSPGVIRAGETEMKLTIKKIILALMAVSVAAVVTSCSEMFVSDQNSPTVALHEFFGYVSDGDYVSAFEMTGNTIDVSSSDLGGSAEELILARISQSIRIKEITEVKFSGVRASQTILVTHIDMRQMIRKILNGIMDETAEYEWKHGSYKSDEEIAAAVKESLMSQLNGDFSNCVIVEKVKIQYRYKDGRWSPVMNEDLYNAITGHASETSGIVEDFFKEYNAKKSK